MFDSCFWPMLTADSTHGWLDHLAEVYWVGTAPDTLRERGVSVVNVSANGMGMFPFARIVPADAVLAVQKYLERAVMNQHMRPIPVIVGEPVANAVEVWRDLQATGLHIERDRVHSKRVVLLKAMGKALQHRMWKPERGFFQSIASGRYIQDLRGPNRLKQLLTPVTG